MRVSDRDVRQRTEFETRRDIYRLMLLVMGGVNGAFLCASLTLDLVVHAGVPWQAHLALAANVCSIIVQAWCSGRVRNARQARWLYDAALAMAVVLGLALTFALGGVAWVGAWALFFTLLLAAFNEDRARSIGAGAAVVLGFTAIAVLQGRDALPAVDPWTAGADPSRGKILVAGLTFMALGMVSFFLVSSIIAYLIRAQSRLLAETSAQLEASQEELRALNRGLEGRVAAKTAEIEAQHRELAVIAEIGKIVNASLDIEHVYAGFMREARKLLPFDQASIAVFTPDGERLRLLRTRVIEGELVEEAHVIPAASSIQATRETRLITDLAQAEPFMERDPLIRDGVACLISMPITSKGALLGTFNVASNTPGAYGAEQVRLMARISEPFALAIANIRLYMEMRALAESDTLTGLPNRRTILQRIRAEIARSRRSGQMASVLMMDLDNFKLFNDSLGHQAGDELLVSFSELLQQACRETDAVARQSGDEFIVLLPETNPADALTVAQRIHQALAASNWCYPGQNRVHVTTSIGVATFPIDAGDDETLLRRADSAMYRAKAAGGGRTELASEAGGDEAPGEGPRQMRFGVIETIANVVASRHGEAGAAARGLAAQTARFATLIAQQMGLPEADRRVLRLASLSHALGIAPDDDGPAEREGDPAFDETYRRLGRLFVEASPGLEDAVRASQFHHLPAGDIATGDLLLARIMGTAEAYARATDAGVPEREALAALRADDARDQRIVDELARALARERTAVA